MKLNVGLLYEAIVRRVAAAAVDGRDRTAASGVHLAKRFFGAGKPLNAELREHLSLFNSHDLAPAPIADALARVRDAVRSADRRAIARDGRLCEHVVHREMGEKLSVSEADWARHAAIAALFNAWRTGDPGRIAARETVVSKLMEAPRVAPREISATQNSQLAANRAVKLFEQKWSTRSTPLHVELLSAAARSEAIGQIVGRIAESVRAELTSRAGDLDEQTLSEARELARADGPETLERGLALADLRAELAGDACTQQT